jgi:hypothetical protein
MLFAQREEAYEGALAPEVVLAFDEYLVENQSEDFLTTQLNEQRGKLGDDVVALEWITLKVDEDKIRKRLLRIFPPIQTEVLV